jgi:hypothetical protein
MVFNQDRLIGGVLPKWDDEESQSIFSAGVDGSVAVKGGSDADGAFLRGRIDRLQQDLKTKLFILLGHL